MLHTDGLHRPCFDERMMPKPHFGTEDQSKAQQIFEWRYLVCWVEPKVKTGNDSTSSFVF